MERVSRCLGTVALKDITEELLTHFNKKKQAYIERMGVMEMPDDGKVVMLLGDMIGLLSGDESTDIPETNTVYVVTTVSGRCGAEVLFDTDFMDSVLEAKFDGDGMFVLPSSIHEVLVMSVEDGMDINALSEMVREVNRAQVNEEELLWDSALVYERGGRLLQGKEEVVG